MAAFGFFKFSAAFDLEALEHEKFGKEDKGRF